MSNSATAGNRFSALGFQLTQLVASDWTQLSKTFELSKNLVENDWWQEQQVQLARKPWKWMVAVARTTTVWVKRQIAPLYQRLSHVLNLGSFVTVTVRLRFSAASWPPKPTARKNAKRYRGDACLGDNRHGSFRHCKGALNPPLVVAWKILNRRSEILRRIIGRLETSVLARGISNRRMITKGSSRCHITSTYHSAIPGEKTKLPPFPLPT